MYKAKNDDSHMQESKHVMSKVSSFSGSVTVNEKEAKSFLCRNYQSSSSTNIVEECCAEGCHLEEVREYCWQIENFLNY